MAQPIANVDTLDEALQVQVNSPLGSMEESMQRDLDGRTPGPNSFRPPSASTTPIQPPEAFRPEGLTAVRSIAPAAGSHVPYVDLGSAAPSHDAQAEALQQTVAAGIQVVGVHHHALLVAEQQLTEQAQYAAGLAQHAVATEAGIGAIVNEVTD